MSSQPPTLVGTVGAVTGGTISVRQAASVTSGISIIGGKSYKVGQVGAFVRIPQGYQELYGVISEVGVNSIPEALRQPGYRGDRWMTVQLVGQAIGGSFERGISQHPSVNDEVHLVVEADLQRIYGGAQGNQVEIGRLANAEGIAVTIDLDRLVTRHSAVLGSTGSGKSTTVASLLRSIALGSRNTPENKFANARILLLDIHGEYGRALGNVSQIFRVNPNKNERPLYIPFWALDPTELLTFLMGRLDDKPLTHILDQLLLYKSKVAKDKKLAGIDLASLTADAPIPFSLKRLWFDLIDPEVKTWEDSQRTKPALVDKGDAETLTIPRYKPHSAGSQAPFMNTIGVFGIRRGLDQLRSRLLDRQYAFMLHPGAWEPNLDGTAQKDLSQLLQEWLGHDRAITILDLSGIPSGVLVRLIGGILRIIYEALFWGREKSEGGIYRPELVVMEEAHRYLSKDTDGPARQMVQRIVKEGRKFGIGAMLISQRPSEVDETILSQCGTFIALRLSNSADRHKVQGLLPDSLAGIVESLPILRTGEAIIVGEAASLPTRSRIYLPNEDERPNSEDPQVAVNWRRNRIREDYGRVVASWRAQDPRFTITHITRAQLSEGEIGAMEREPVASSNIVAIGYDSASETLEVEFKNGLIYQYYNVPQPVHEQLMQAPSKGQFLNAYIRNAYAFSRV